MARTTDFEKERRKHTRKKFIKRLAVLIAAVVLFILVYAFRFDIASQGVGVLLSDTMALLLDNTGYPVAIESEPAQLIPVGRRAALITQNSLLVYNSAGNRVVDKRTSGQNTVAVTGGKYLLTYCEGGYDLELRSGETLLFSKRFTQPIYCADAAANGAVAASLGAVGDRAQVVVYDAAYEEQFVWLSSEQIVYSLALNKSADALAVGGARLSNGALQSDITVFDITSGDSLCNVKLQDEMLLALKFVTEPNSGGSRIVVVTDRAVHYVDHEKNSMKSFSYESAPLVAFDISSIGETAVALGDFSGSHSVRLIKLGFEAKQVASCQSARNIKSLHFFNSTELIASIGNRAVWFDRDLQELKVIETPEAMRTCVVGKKLYYATAHELCMTQIK